MRGILGLMVMASVVFAASLTSINTQRGTGKSDRKRGTVCNPFLLFASKSVRQARGFIRSNTSLSFVNFIPQNIVQSLK